MTFARPAHQIVFAVHPGRVRASEPADAITILARLQASGEITRVGGAPYLHTLIESVPVAASGGYYARTVRDRAVRRRLLEAGRRITALALSAAEDAHGLTEQAVREAEAVRDSGRPTTSPPRPSPSSLTSPWKTTPTTGSCPACSSAVTG